MSRCKVILITGGQRSGKSSFAENLVLSLSTNPLYIATAQIYDEEMRDRVKLHQQRRGNSWTNIEAPYNLDIDIKGKTVLFDCLTMFATNHFFDKKEECSSAVEAVIQELDKLISQEDATLVIVSNELGLGGISPNPMQRRFTDLQGTLNQYVASKADEAYLIVAGLPLKLK